VSVPKVKCPSCGVEWTGPVVFCGECGTPITAASGAAPGDRVARVPPAPRPTTEAAPAARPMAASAKPVVEAKPVDAKPAEAARPSRPSDVESRRTVMGMPAVAPAEPAKPARKDPPAKKQRRGSIVIAAEPATHEEAEQLLDALEAGFDSIVRPGEPPVVSITPSVVPDVPVTSPPPDPESPKPPAQPIASRPGKTVVDEATRRAQHEADMAEVRALFTDMAVGHARPLRDFMIEVSWGDPTREWLDVAIPASTALRRAAEAMEMAELGAALEGFIAALELAAGEATIGRDAKDLLLGTYGKLTDLLPAAFALEGERGRREPIIVRALLLQVPGVRKVALDKIYAAGLTSLEMLYAAGPRELSETTGLDVELAARIHERFERYRSEVTELDPAKDRAAERAELAALHAELSRAHDEHERLARAWTPDAAAGRVRARRERSDAVLRISVLLARIGEVDRLKALEKVPFAQKIRDLQTFLDEAKRKAARP